MKFQRVLLSRIDITTEGWDDFIFELYPDYVDRLAESFERVGQIYPLILMKNMDWLFIVAGYSKFLAMKKLGVEEAWARLFQINEISVENLLWLSLEEKCGRQLGDRAQHRIFQKFRDIAGYDVEKLAHEVAPAIGLEASTELVEKMLKEADG